MNRCSEWISLVIAESHHISSNDKATSLACIFILSTLFAGPVLVNQSVRVLATTVFALVGSGQLNQGIATLRGARDSASMALGPSTLLGHDLVSQELVQMGMVLCNVSLISSKRVLRMASVRNRVATLALSRAKHALLEVWSVFCRATFKSTLDTIDRSFLGMLWRAEDFVTVRR